ncbi:MAG: lysylphosphatidylglycerol synthase domain-containing protein [Nevskiales bacterium]
MATPKKTTKRKWWPLAQRILTIAFLLLVAGLIASRARAIEWDQVLESLRNYRGLTLVLAAAFAAASYLVYSCFDLLGRAYTRHAIPRLRVMAIAFVSYSFNLNLGATIGGVGFRFRLYSRAGLRRGLIARIIVLSLTTNWLGICFLTGAVFVFSIIPLPQAWGLGATGLQLVGALLLAAVASYLLFCVLARRRSWHVRHVHLELPPVQMAFGQLALSSLNWLLVTGVMFVLLRQQIAFPTVMGVLLTSSFAGIVIRIPAGLGVIEAVFLALLSRQMAQTELLAALFAYRAIYYLGPLLLGIATYLLLEGRLKRSAGAARI